MKDLAMCKNEFCPMSDNCWRFNAPYELDNQEYSDFKYDPDTFQCEFYVAMDELDFKSV
jgi:hypothetical protein